MKVIFVFFPLVLLAIAFIFGYARLGRAAVFFLSWVTMCSMLYVHAFVSGIGTSDPRFLLLAGLALLLTIPSILFAALVGVSNKKQPGQSPADIGVELYQGLSDDEKKKVQDVARKGGAIAARNLGAYLEKKGYVSTGNSLREISHLL